MPPKKTATTRTPLEREQLKRQQRFSATNLYLIAYNVASAAAWGAVLLRLILHMTGDTSVWTVKGALGLQSTAEKIATRAGSGYADFGDLTRWVQTAALLEIAHAGLGLVRSSFATTSAQVFSRIVLVWGVCQFFPAVTASPIYVTMVLAWSFTEVVRYSYYAAGLLDIKVPILEWIRYNAFYILYPMGAGSEAYLMALSAPHAGAIYGALGHYGILALTAFWPIALFVLMSHMHVQRKKQMRKSSLSKTDAKADNTPESTPARSTRSSSKKNI